VILLTPPPVYSRADADASPPRSASDLSVPTAAGCAAWDCSATRMPASGWHGPGFAGVRGQAPDSAAADPPSAALRRCRRARLGEQTARNDRRERRLVSCEALEESAHTGPRQHCDRRQRDERARRRDMGGQPACAWSARPVCPASAFRSLVSIFSAAAQATHATMPRCLARVRDSPVQPRIVAPGRHLGPPAGGLGPTAPSPAIGSRTGRGGRRGCGVRCGAGETGDTISPPATAALPTCRAAASQDEQAPMAATSKGSNQPAGPLQRRRPSHP